MIRSRETVPGAAASDLTTDSQPEASIRSHPSSRGTKETPFDRARARQALHFDNKTPLMPWPKVLRDTGFRYSHTAKDALLGRVLKSLDLNHSSEVLDVGSGVGVWLDRLHASFGTSGVGIDVSLKSIQVAKRECSNRNRFVVADGRFLPFKSDHFDVCLCLDTLEHIEHPNRIMAEIVRVSKSGSQLLAYAVSKRRQFTLEWFQEKLIAAFGFDLLTLSAHHRDLLVDPGSILEFLRWSGVEIRQFHYFHSFFASLFDQPLLIGNLVLKKMGAFNLTLAVQKMIGHPALFVATKLTRSALRLLELLDSPWARMGRSNGFMILAQVGKKEAIEAIDMVGQSGSYAAGGRI